MEGRHSGLPLAVLFSFGLNWLSTEVFNVFLPRRARVMDASLVGAAQVPSADTPIYMFLGSIAGIILPAIPGFTNTMAIVLTLPQTFSTDSLQSVTVMLSVYVGGYTGGLISALLLGIPVSAVDAILMASLVVHGIRLGPRLIMDNADLVHGVFLAMALASAMMLIVRVVSMRAFLRVAGVPNGALCRSR